MSTYLRIIFAGTSAFAAFHLKALIKSSHKIISVLTKPDRPAGRGYKITSNIIKKIAEKYNLPVFQPYSLQEKSVLQYLNDLNADIIVVVSYGLIFPQEIINMPKYGCINVHGSLLPRWRGAAPIQRAICAGDIKTGIAIIQMDSGLDTGDLLYKTSCNIESNETYLSLHDKLAKFGQIGLLFILNRIFFKKKIKKEPQNPAYATYAYKIKKEEARIDWSLSANQLFRCIRAFNPWPISYFLISGQLVRVWDAIISKYQYPLCSPGTILMIDKSNIYISTGDGSLGLTLLQVPGRKVMSAQNFLNSYRKLFTIGTILD